MVTEMNLEEPASHVRGGASRAEESMSKGRGILKTEKFFCFTSNRVIGPLGIGERQGVLS